MRQKGFISCTMEKRRLDPLGSVGSSYESDSVHNAYTMYSSDEEDDGISFTTTETKCERLFDQGLELKVCGEIERALSCFLDCLKGMQECQYFAKLPQTLRHLKELYNSLGNIDYALEFAQAEKLFYEAVLVSTSSESTPKQTLVPQTSARPKRKLFSKRRSTKSSGSNPAEYGDLLIKKANEYEMLAKMCAQEKNFDLALDYSGKAAKLKRSVYGSEHPDTVATMESFSVLYAEVGRAEYAAALNKVSSERTEHPQASPESSVDPLPPVSNHRGQEAVSTIEDQPAVVSLQEYSSQDAQTQLHSSACKHTSHTRTNLNNESTLLSNSQQNCTVQLMQPCTLVECASPAKLTNTIHWSGEPDNVLDNGGEQLVVCVHKPELNIEHTRFCPLWVLLLGAFLELVLVAYVVYLR